MIKRRGFHKTGSRRRSCIYFDDLGSADAAEIAKLQKRLFPVELRESREQIKKIFLSTEKHLVCNLSFGLFDGTHMVGYMFAYVESESLVYKREEELVYIKEIGLLPGYERYLRSLFFKLYEQWLAFTPGIPIEAHALDDSLAKWKRLGRMFKFFGLTLSHTREVRKEGRPPYNLLRLDVADYTTAIYSQPQPLPRQSNELVGGVSVSVVTDPRQWLSLREVWDDLLRQTDDSNVFQSFEFLWQWWKYFGTWNDLYIIVIRRNNNVIGVVPFMREYFDVFGRVVRKLLFLTAPMEMSRPKLIFGRDADACWPAFLDFVAANSGEWDILDIDEQLLDGCTKDLRDNVRRQRWLIADSETLCPYIDLTGGWAAFRAGLPRKMRSNINRLRRRLAEEGSVNVRLINSWPALDAGLDVHCEIEEHSWKAQKSLNISGDRSYYHYYASLAESFGHDKRFEQRILECDGRPIASTFGIASGGVFQSMKIAHDSRYDRFSPGTVLESYELESMFESNLERYEFMGSFLTNKLRWTSAVHTTENIHIYQRQPRLIIFYFVYFILKRHVVKLLRMTGQFERVSQFLMKFRANPFPRY